MKKKILILAALVLTLACVLSLGALTVSAEETEPSVTIAKFNLAFEDNTYLKYAVRFDGVADSAITENNIGMLYWTDYEGGFVPGTEDFSSETTGYTTISDVKHYVFEYTHLAAKQLTDYIYSVAYIELDGTTYYSEPVKYSALEYAYNRLGKTSEGSSNAELKSLLNNMLAYGASAQQYFDYKEDRLATDDFYQLTLVGGTLDDGFASGLYLSTDEVTITAPETNGDLIFAGWQNSAGEIEFITNIATVENIGKNETYTANMVFVCPHFNTTIISGKPATCTETGLTDGEKCVRCEEIITEQIEIEALGHTEVLDHAVAPTCTKTGLAEGKHCSVCNEIIVLQTVVDMLAHSYVDRICTVCGKGYFSEGLKYTSNGDGTCYVSGIGTCVDTEIVIPSTSPNGDSVISIGSYAFKKCTTLTSVIIPDSVIQIENSAFYYCSSLVSIIIPNSVTTIGNFVFDHCNALPSITIPDSVISIGRYAFNYCKSLANIAIPHNVTTISDHMFYECTSLKNVTILGCVTTIENYAFGDCSNLNTINIPDTVISIGDNSFYSCQSLIGITIPENVKTIGSNAFQYCYKLIEVINRSSLNITIGSSNYGYVAYYAKKVHNGESELVVRGDYIFYTYSEVNYLVAYTGNDTVIVLPQSYNNEDYVIYDRGFTNCKSLINVTIPDSVTSIGSFAFYGCSGITSITIPNSISIIDHSTFGNCTSLTSITIPDSITNINGFAFAGCSSLKSVHILNSVTSIGYYAFNGCSLLTNVTFENPNGWWYASSSSATSGTSISAADLADSEKAATYLTSTYRNYYWNCTEE